MKRYTLILLVLLTACSCVAASAEASAAPRRFDVSLVRPTKRLALFEQMVGVWGRIEILSLLDEESLKPVQYTGLITAADGAGLSFKVAGTKEMAEIRVFQWNLIVAFTSMEEEALENGQQSFMVPRRVTMRDGKQYVGHLVERTPTTLKLLCEGGVSVEVLRIQVLSVEALRSSPQEVAKPASGTSESPAKPGAESIARMQRPEAQREQIARKAEAVLERRIAQGRQPSSSKVDTQKKSGDGNQSSVKGEPYSRDPNRTRYLFAPTARTMEKGEVYVSQKQLFMTEVGIAVHDNVTIVVGGVLPSWFAPKGFNMVLGAKFGLEITEGLHWAAGLYGVAVPGFMFHNADFAGGGIAYTSLTFGSEDIHGSVSAGAPFVFGAGEGFYDPVLVVSGNFRIKEDFALVTENWVMPTLLAQDGNALAGLVNTACGRYIADGWAMDFGFIRIHGLPDDVPLLPWLDFTWHWDSDA